ncbi:NEL-type E3 ubiquitin ligase domain-containing protein [Pseudomonas sp. Z2-11]
MRKSGLLACRSRGDRPPSTFSESTMNTPITVVLPRRKIAHHKLIEKALPEWIAKTPLKQLEHLKTIRPELPDWFKQATPAQHKELRGTHTDSWTKRNEVEKELERSLDVHSFAEPLLKKHIKQRFNIDLDVRETFINLYIPTRLPIIDLPTDGSKQWRVSVLDAALHNFEAREGEADAHLPESGFITRPDAHGRFRILDEVTGKLPVDQFVRFCRELDIGRRYDTHLREELGLDDHGKQLRLKTRIIASQLADLKAVLHHASLTLAIQKSSLQSLLAFIAGRDNTWQTYDLTLLSTPLTGPMIFSPGNEWSASAPVVVYIPHDPKVPLKEYPSMAAFMTHLTEQLRGDSYKKFFSRFIQHDQLGSFHEALKRKFFHVIEDRPNAPDFGMPEHGFVEDLKPIPDPSLDYSASKISGNVLEELYNKQLSKIFKDAKVIAVSTDSEDRKTRHDRWERIKSIGLALFNAALFVIAPFVPVVGELMLLQMAYQLLEDAYEGVRDWVAGKSIEAFEHLFSIVETVLQAAGFAVGGSIVGDLLAKPSSFVKNLKPVISTDGKTRLWNPDPAPYAHPIEVPPTSKPDTLGLHEHDSRILLKLAADDDSQHTLALSKTAETERYTLTHPTRPDAYSPRMEHNGQGAWLMEGEQPQAWKSQTLMRRLGHATDGFSDAKLQQLRIISGTDEGVLRRVHLQNEAMPPLLDDTLARFRTYRTVGQNIGRIRAGEALDTQGGWFEPLVTELDGWPSDKALEVFADSTLTGTPHHYGASVPSDDTFKISLADLNGGKLAPLIVEGLDEQQLSDLVGSQTPKEQAPQRLNEKLADRAVSRKMEIFEQEYREQEPRQAPEAALIENTIADLPAPVTRVLLDTATPAENTVMTDQNRVPLRLRNLAEEMHVQTRITRAQEGLLEDNLLTPEGETLTLNTLKAFSDAISDVHIEVRDKVIDGTLRANHQPQRATLKRVLVRTEPGKYEVRDTDDQLLHPAKRFHNALLNALPPKNLGKLTSRFKPGEKFRDWLIDQYQNTRQIRTAMDFPAVGASTARETETLLRGPIYSRLWPAAEALPAEVDPLAERLKEIYPTRDEEQIANMVSRLDSDEQMQKLAELEDEKAQLFDELDKWASTLPRHINARRILAARREITRRIKDSWLRGEKEQIRTNGEISREDVTLKLDQISFEGVKIEDLALSKKLPHVIKLSLIQCNLSSLSTDFLSNFPEVQVLTAVGNNLQSLPEALNDLPTLRVINLSQNKIVIDPASAASLQKPALLSLNLNQNPLGFAPDVSQLPALKALMLNRTQITDWPQGLFSLPRPEHFDLQMQGNQITTVPDCEAGSPEAWIVARTRLDRQKLDLQNDEKLANYRRSVGLDPHRTYPPRGDKGSAFWVKDYRGTDLEALRFTWDILENEVGSQGFFEVIAKLEITDDTLFETDEDQEAYEENRSALTDQVWRVIEAASDDIELREKLFTMADAPTNCADAGAQIFNAMGIETMLSEFSHAGSDAPTLEKNLIGLARGKARLNKLYEIARADVAQRVSPVEKDGLGLRFTSEVINGEPGTVDEVEVHTAYQARFVNSLELPWVSKHMVYRNTANVTEPQIQNAMRLVREGERNGGLVNQILDVEFWDTYLSDAYADRLQANDELYEAQAEQLEELRDLQHEWVDSNTRLEDRDPAKKQRLIELASQLSVPEADVLTADKMPDSIYNRAYSAIADRRKELRRQLTSEAITRAGLV